jgi:hypothetical protein
MRREGVSSGNIWRGIEEERVLKKAAKHLYILSPYALAFASCTGAHLASDDGVIVSSYASFRQRSDNHSLSSRIYFVHNFSM